MKLLIIGNHTCGNRGDSAILRGLISAIETVAPDAQIVATSRYPTSSSFLLGRHLRDDPLSRWHATHRKGIHGLIQKWSIPLLLALSIRTGWTFLNRILPTHIANEISYVKQFDAVLQVGGSFFVDLYGPTQFEHAFTAILAKRPTFLVGHSMGPFEGVFYRWLSSTLLKFSTKVYLRESSSHDVISQFKLTTAHVAAGSDTAWLVAKPAITETSRVPLTHDTALKRQLIAVSLRDLAPFGERLCTNQDEYESAFAKTIDELIACGCTVVAISTCTGIDSYHKDDRMPALRVKNKLNRPEHFLITMDEFNDIELGQLLSECALVIGTRLHSAIIAMNFGTPAIAISYEHKSAGVMNQIALSDLAWPLESLLDGSLSEFARGILPDVAELRLRVSAAVEKEQIRALMMVESCIDILRSNGVAAVVD